MPGLALDDNVRALAQAFGSDMGTVREAAESASTAATQADAKADGAISSLAKISSREQVTYFLADYLHPSDLAAAMAGNTSGQDASRVTAAVQEMHRDGLLAWTSANQPYRKVRFVYIDGMIRINDEMFDEVTAQAIWSTPFAIRNGRAIFDFQNLTVLPDFPTNRAVRTSGYYAQHNITYAVPKVVFRLMKDDPSPMWMAEFHGVMKIRGALNMQTDPVGVYIANTNDAHGYGGWSADNLMNHGTIIEGIFNSRFANIGGSAGYQPTDFGGATGLIPSTARFSVTGTALTANEAVFTAAHVGKTFFVAQAGPTNAGGSTRMPHVATITAVASGTAATLSLAAAVAVTDQRGSFDAVKVSTTAGSAVATLSAAITGDLTGRLVTVVGNYPQSNPFKGHLLTATIIVHSGDQITLSLPAHLTQSAAPIVFSAGVHAAPTDVAYVHGMPKNDMLHLPRLWCEDGGFGNKGGVSMVVSGVHIDIDGGAKLHGAPTGNGNNWAGNFTNMVCGEAKGLRYCGTTTHGAYSQTFGKHIFAGDAVDAVMEGESNSFPAAAGSADVYMMPAASGLSRFRVYHDMSLYGFGGDGFEGQVFARGNGAYVAASMFLVRGTARRSDSGVLVRGQSEFRNVSVENTLTVAGSFSISSSPNVAANLDTLTLIDARVQTDSSTVGAPPSSPSGWRVDVKRCGGTVTLQVAHRFRSNEAPVMILRHNNNTGGAWSAWAYPDGTPF